MPRRPFHIGRSFTGFGLFATRPIKKKSHIAEYKGPILGHEEALRAEARGNRYLFEVSKHRTIDGTPRSNIARYANHSCNPNAEPVIWRGRVFIKALRDIKPGEEIAYDYERFPSFGRPAGRRFRHGRFRGRGRDQEGQEERRLEEDEEGEEEDHQEEA